MEYLGGRSDRFELLVRRYAQELLHFSYRLVGSAAVSEDIVQETFLQVHLSAEQFDASKRFRPWVFTIAANKARDHLRSRKRRPEIPLDAVPDGTAGDGPSYKALLRAPSAAPFMGMESEERSFLIRRLVDQLPVHLREVLILGYYHGFAYKEMAAILGVPLGTIKSRLHVAVGQFGQLYADSRPDDQRAGAIEAKVKGDGGRRSRD
jgi:RNA polymerase sigma-70 factor (ECF subfamily)